MASAATRPAVVAVVIHDRRQAFIGQGLGPLAGGRHGLRVDGCTMNALAQLSTIDRTTLTREVDQLVALDLVARSVPPHDRRQISLSLTPKGDKTYKQGIPILRAFNRTALAGVEHEKLREMARTLRIIVPNLIADPAKAEDVLAFARPVAKARP